MSLWTRIIAAADPDGKIHRSGDVAPVDDQPAPIASGTAESFGWLRRGDLENKTSPHIQVWEAGDGQLYRHDRRQGPLMVGRYKVNEDS